MKKNTGEKGILLVKILLCVALICLYGLFMVWRCSYVNINSDFANLVLEGRDILEGDFFRREWNLTGVSFLTTDLPFFGLGVLFFGVSNEAYVLACALMDVALVIASVLLIKDKISQNKVMIGLLMLTFAMTPCLSAIDLLRAHTGTFIFGFVLIYLFISLCDKENNSNVRDYSVDIFLFVFLLAVAVMGDPIILVVVVFPICFWSLYSWLRKKIYTKQMLLLLGINALGTILGNILDKLYFLIGGANKNGFLGNVVFISIAELGYKLILYFKSLFFMADAFFEHHPVLNIMSVFFAINVIAVIVFFVLIFYNIICFLMAKKHDLITVVLGVGFICLSVLFICTSVSVDFNSARYMCYFPVLMTVVFARNISLVPNKDRMYYLIMIVVIASLIGKVYTIKNDQRPSTLHQEQLAEYLEENGLENGYSSFWNASSVTVLSNERVKIRSIEANGDDFQMHNWFCRSDWYVEPSNFVVTDEDDPYGVMYENVIDAIGKPCNELQCGEYRILVYDHNICDSIVK